MAVPRSPILASGAAHPVTHDVPEDIPVDIQEEDPDVQSRTARGLDPEDALARAMEALEEARAEIRNQRAIIATLQRASTHTPAAEMPREPKVNKPNEFNGKISEYHTFMSQCVLIFSMCPSSYREDEQKVLFVISYLGKNARDWARPVLENDKHPYRNDFGAFKKALDTLYVDRNLKHQARDELSRLKQAKSAAAYSVEFQQVIAPLELNDEAKHLLFYLGLKDTIKDALATVGEEKTFYPLVDQVIAIDQRQHQRRMEEKKSSSTRPHESSKANGKKPAVYSQAPKQSSSHSQPRGPISEDEKERRHDNNLCFRCVSPDHKAHACPLRRSGASNVFTPGSFAPEYTPPKFPQENWPSQGT